MVTTKFYLFLQKYTKNLALSIGFISLLPLVLIGYLFLYLPYNLVRYHYETLFFFLGYGILVLLPAFKLPIGYAATYFLGASILYILLFMTISMFVDES